MGTNSDVSDLTLDPLQAMVSKSESASFHLSKCKDKISYKPVFFSFSSTHLLIYVATCWLIPGKR